MGRGKSNAKGRSKGSVGSFTKLPHKIQESVAYRSLTPNAKALLSELVYLDRNDNNGLLFLSEKDAADRIGLSNKKSVRTAFNDLSQAGLILMTKGAYFNVKTGEGRARSWALTWRFDYCNRRSPIDSWQDFEPVGSAAKRAARGCRSLKEYKRSRKSAEDNSTLSSIGRQFKKDNSTGLNAEQNTKLPKERNLEKVISYPHTAVTIGSSLTEARSWREILLSSLKMEGGNFAQFEPCWQAPFEAVT
jgi:hypothetical protein